MKSDTWIGRKGFRYWYYRYRDSQYYMFALFGLITVICIYLIVSFVIPELTNWFSIRNEVVATQAQIAILQQNISFINSLDKTSLDSQLQTASNALPSGKDFGSILQVIAVAAQTSGMSVSDYSFQVGNISPNATKRGLASTESNSVSTVPVTVIVSGSLDNLITFIKTLESSLPISEITRVTGSGQTFSVTMQFYNEPFPQVKYSTNTQLTPISEVKVRQLEQLSQWDHTKTPQSPVLNSSGSAVPVF